ncbi:unnamed protein product, partial [Staurois parvus]
MLLTLVVSMKNALYIGGQYEECFLHWCQWEECSLRGWSVEILLFTVGRMLIILLDRRKNASSNVLSMGRMLLTFIVSRKNAHLTVVVKSYSYSSRDQLCYAGGSSNWCWTQKLAG